MNKKDILSMSLEELEKDLALSGIPHFRANQVMGWVYKKGKFNFDEMANLPPSLKEAFEKRYFFKPIKLKERLKSKDKTLKFLFELEDSRFIESVLIDSGRRKTLCLSTQVGCSHGCVFCASTSNGLKRNLTSSEITSQILFIAYKEGHKIDNYVFMGMGEPLDNYNNLVKAIFIMNASWGLEIGARRITISTCGIVPGIQKLKNMDSQVNLSVSLHAADNKLRDAIVPINRVYPLEKLLASCRDYIRSGGRKITLEYVLIKGLNDSPVDAKKLSTVAKYLTAKVNLIPYSPVINKDFTASSAETQEAFRETLLRNRVDVTLRRSKGSDIQAACGQLALRTT